VHCDPHPANVLVRPDPVRGAPHAQLVLLDHGLYRELSDDFRVAYAALWRALVFGDVEVIRRQCQRFNAGDMYPTPPSPLPPVLTGHVSSLLPY
jgi:aarF domain-containing kinase